MYLAGGVVCVCSVDIAENPSNAKTRRAGAALATKAHNTAVAGCGGVGQGKKCMKFELVEASLRHRLVTRANTTAGFDIIALLSSSDRGQMKVLCPFLTSSFHPTQTGPRRQQG
jgi:hypothetical protein